MTPVPTVARLSANIGELIVSAHKGDRAARNELIVFATRALEKHARRCLGNDPQLHRWELTSDVLQDMALRLTQAIDRLQFDTPRHFLNLAAEIIRGHLIDLRRRYFGPEGIGANHASDPADGSVPTLAQGEAKPHDPLETLAMHELVERLPEAERETLNLVHYFRYKHAEAAVILGIGERTVRKYLTGALCKLREWLRVAEVR